MNIRKLILTLLLTLPLTLAAQDLRVKATQFGIRSDGATLNTTSIQAAIDYIHERGGGTLEFYVGRYLTGGLKLKSNVHIYLDEAAVLVGSNNPYDYANVGYSALITAHEAQNIGISGKGVIEGAGRELIHNILAQIHNGSFQDKLTLDRPSRRPMLISFSNCDSVEVKGIMMRNSSSWVQVYYNCQNVLIDGIIVNNNTFWNNDGLDLMACKNVKVLNSYINATDDAICLKAEGGGRFNSNCENIEIRNCTARSSANGIKFGSWTIGDYRNIKIINCKVYDTFRSAVNLASPDGGTIDNILIDSLHAENVGNGIYLRLNARSRPEKKGQLKNVTISNAYIQVAADKPDAGYMYEGPVEDNPRNVSPCGIMGLPDRIIENVTLKNIEIVQPGGGDPFYAKAGISPQELDAQGEYANSYPDFSKVMELPAWGFFIRHAKSITFENVTLRAEKHDYRPSLVLVDVKDSSFKGMKFSEPNAGKKEQVVQYKTDNVTVKVKK